MCQRAVVSEAHQREEAEEDGGRHARGEENFCANSGKALACAWCSGGSQFRRRGQRDAAFFIEHRGHVLGCAWDVRQEGSAGGSNLRNPYDRSRGQLQLSARAWY
jgi:hypothetical protein